MLSQRHQHHRKHSIAIHPGEWRVESERPISTLLGSCVAVCLYDPKLQLVGMNHFLLPNLGHRKYAQVNRELSGEYAMEILVNAMLKNGARKSRLEAKAFGGGTVAELTHFEIGQRNAEFATKWLMQDGIPLLASDFGGNFARQVVLLPENGEALCRRISVSAQSVQARLQKAAQREREYAQTLSKTRPPSDGIEFF